MAQWDAGTIIANGVEVPVQVDDVFGTWGAQYAGQDLRYDTREKLVNKLTALTRKTAARVEIPVIRVTPYTGWGEGNATVTRGMLTGLHSGNGNVLAAWELRGTPVKEQIDGRGRAVYVGHDTTDDELDEYVRLLRLERETVRKISDWEKAHTVKPKDVVEQAIKARVGEGDDA